MTAPRTVPVYHYFDLGRLGRGEVVKLFLMDAGIDIKEVRYPYDETWSENSKKLQQRGLTRTRKLPTLEYQDLILSQHIPILRFFARDLGRYDGETNAEKFLVDAVSDIYIDWRSQWVANLTEKSDKYKNEVAPEYYNLLDQYYRDQAGPYLLGNSVTYADFAVYQSIDNDERTGTLPLSLPDSLVKFREAFEQRSNIAAYLKETRQS
ncbi:glutathione S-transferase [Aspergillus pseudotamarii]|uniref:Glutathione S-transferase n=1 Tax=Aspergillus pseudotamarii TaxID=132259 RepID=A0A5N6SYY5_ASPPS|nr:glutathione S-transferase [Aspergillus pseudotamarii]KAE8138989.1 glutathione S-transferase [Aspergillus pseudotamarii]